MGTIKRVFAAFLALTVLLVGVVAVGFASAEAQERVLHQEGWVWGFHSTGRSYVWSVDYYSDGTAHMNVNTHLRDGTIIPETLDFWFEDWMGLFIIGGSRSGTDVESPGQIMVCNDDGGQEPDNWPNAPSSVMDIDHDWSRFYALVPQLGAPYFTTKPIGSSRQNDQYIVKVLDYGYQGADACAVFQAW